MIGLSKSSLEVFQSCPRCFWADKNQKVGRPRGIFPGLPKGMDRVMKAAVENAVAKRQAVVYLRGIDAEPFADRARIVEFQSWRTFQAVLDLEGVEVKAWGEIDDVLMHMDGLASPWDFKSKADAPPEGYSEKYYQLQGDLYALLLGANGVKCSGRAYFTYTWPEEVQGGVIRFGNATQVVVTSEERARKVLKEAATCLALPLPRSSADCEYCRFISKRNHLDAYGDRPEA